MNNIKEYNIIKMSISINLEDVTEEIKQYIRSNFIIKKKADFYNSGEREQIKVYDRQEKFISLPFHSWIEIFEEFPNKFDKKSLSNMKYTDILYTSETDPHKRNRDQVNVANHSLDILRKSRSLFLSLFTGFGKTRMACYLMCSLGMKTLILSHLSALHQQTKEEIESCTTAKVQIIKGKNKIDPDADVYIMGIIKANSYCQDDFPRGIGTIIIDESHIVTETAFTNTLMKYKPQYLIGLSATPDRNDGLDKLFELFFGKENFITRVEKKNFTIINHFSPFSPKLEYYMVKGKLVPKWSELINSLEDLDERQEYIINLLEEYKNKCILILCNRENNTMGIYQKLKDRGESVDYLCGTKKNWDRNSRILVAGFKKGGVGLNHPGFNMLVMASDAKDIRQYEGRIRTPNNIILDIVDNYHGFERHWKNFREKWYISKGGTIIEA